MRSRMGMGVAAPAVPALMVVVLLILPGTASLGESLDGPDSNPPPVPMEAPEHPAPSAPQHLENFSLTASFLASLQAPDGGEFEAEDNPYENTDNTLEAIWVWSRYTNVTGDTQFVDEIADAWAYAQTYPAWLEPDSGKVYSSAWAVRAEMEYRRTFGDASLQWYGTTAADYIVAQSAWEPPLPPFALPAREHIRGWAAGNLYDYGLDLGNDAYRWAAVGYANATKASIEADPTLLGSESWAMAGGASMWGVVHARMAEFPNPAWAETYGPFLKTEVTTPGSGPGNSQNGWEAWYALGHHAVHSVTGNATYYGTFLNITDRLVQRDGDRDGGIPTNVGDPDDTDESWVTAYRAFFCLRQLLSMDAGVPPDGATFKGADLSADLQDVVLTWAPPMAQDVERFDIFAGFAHDRNGTGYAYVGSAPAAATTFVHLGAGANQTRHYYRLHTVDTEGFSNASEYQVGKFFLPVFEGPNLVSIPFADPYPVEEALQTLPYDWVRHYDAAAGLWREHHQGKTASSRDLVELLPGRGYWVNVSADSELHVAGFVRPKPTQSPLVVPLMTGWNLVGFPYLSPRTVADALAGVTVLEAEGFDFKEAPYRLRPLAPSDLLDPGAAFWVRVDSDQDWSIDWWS